MRVRHRIQVAGAGAIGLVTAVSWQIDAAWTRAVQAIRPEWVTQKESTAWMITGISAAILLLVGSVRGSWRERLGLYVSGGALLVLILAVVSLLQSNGSVGIAVELLGGREEDYTLPGEPSVMTLIAAAGLLVDIIGNGGRVWGSRIALVVGVVALAGYAIGEPILYGTVEGVSGAMAITTAVALTLVAESRAKVPWSRVFRKGGPT